MKNELGFSSTGHLALALVCSIWLSPQLVRAINRTVTNLNDSGAGSLRETIAASAAGDTIILSVSGTITLTGGELAIGRDLTINGPGAKLLAVSGNNASRVFNISRGIVTISDLTIANGRVAGTDGVEGTLGHPAGGPGSHGLGGGILNGGTLTLMNCTLSGNTAAGGNGGYSYPSLGFGGSGGSGEGGGICNQGTLNMANCTLSGNTATGGAGGYAYGNYTADGGSGDGGSIYNQGTLNMANCTLSGNTATGGRGGAGGPATGGAICTGSILNLTNCTLSGNSAVGGDGGEGYLYGRVGGVGDGGGIFNQGGLTLVNCTLSGNSAIGGRGGRGGDLNWGSGGNGGNANGGGIYHYLSSPSSFVTLWNTIVGENSDKYGFGGFGGHESGPNGIASGPDVFGAITSQGRNMIGRTDGSSGWVAADLTGTSATPLNPLLGPLQNNGGPTLTMMLQASSAAIDAGDDSVTNSFATDQRGYPREIGAHVDIGAAEYDPPQTGPGLVVTTLDDHDDGVASISDCTLREAIRASDDSTITFAPGLNGTLTLRLGELTIGRNARIAGPCAKQLTISGNDSSRVFHVAGGIVNLSGLTIAHGRGVVPWFGGGILNGGTLNLTNCALVSNSAATSGNGGGAILNEPSGVLTLHGCTVTDNFSQFGGALHNQGVLTAVDSTISDNFTSIAATIYSSGTLSLKGCTVAGNHAASGGGLYNDGGFASLANCLIVANQATNNLSPDVAGTFVSLGYNLVSTGDGSVGLTNDVNHDQVGSVAAPINALLEPLADNGGCTATHRLLKGSPAIDQGKNFGLAIDQRGAPRPFASSSVANPGGGDGSDIGAFELGSPLLSIALAAPNTVMSWPAYYGDFALQSSTDLVRSSDWLAVPGVPAIVGDRFNVTNSPVGPTRFFRLLDR